MGITKEIKNVARNPLSWRSGAVAAVLLTAGIGVGFGIESNTNDVARGKAATATACLKAIPHETAVTTQLDDCFEKGVPGGQKIGRKVFEVGDPTTFVDQYIISEQREAAHTELGRVALWSIGAPALTVAYSAAFL